MKRILVIGRFQPFHQGHLSMIQEALKHAGELVIAVGSAENSYKDINPFTAGERIEMIHQVLREESIPLEKVYIIPVRDIHDDEKWVAHVQSLVPKFDLVYTGSNSGYAYIQKLFVKAGVEVEVFKNVLDIEASKIRKAIQNDDPIWKTFVPPAILEYLESTEAIERIKNIKHKGSKKTSDSL